MNLLTLLHAAIALFCLVLSLHFMLTASRRRWPLLVLGITYLLYTCQSLLLVLQFSGFSVSGWPQLLRLIGAMLLAPLFWWFFQLLRRPNAQWRWTDLWHALPAGATAVLLLSNSPLLQWLDLFLLLSFSAYLITVGSLLLRGAQQLAPLGDDAPIARRYLLAQGALLLVNLLIEVALYFEIQQGATLNRTEILLPAAWIFLLLHLLTLLFALQRSPLLEWLYSYRTASAQPDNAVQITDTVDDDNPPGVHAANPIPSPAVDEKLMLIYQRWLEMLEQQQLYQLEFGITLAQAARKLQVPARQLSNAINQCYGNSFSVLLNDRRIHQAKQLLTEQPLLPVTEVMYQAGFATKSNFHKEFVRVTGMTPSAYRANAPAQSD